MSCEINLRFRRFGSGTGQLTGLNQYYIARDATMLGAGRRSRGPMISLKMGTKPAPATISPCTFTMDHAAIIYFMTDGLARGPDQDVHVPSVGSKKYPSYNVDGIYS